MFVWSELTDPLEVAAVALQEAATEDRSGWSDAALTERVVALASLAERADAATADAVRGWEPTKAWQADGARSAKTWLTQHTPLDEHAAARHLRCARQLRRRPQVAKSLTAAEITLDHITALARCDTPARRELFERDEHILLGAASTMGADEFALVVRNWLALADDHLADHDAMKMHESRHLHLSQTYRGTWVINGQLDPEAGARLHHALGLCDHPDPPDSPAHSTIGPRTPAQRRADALDELARRELAGRNHASGAPTRTVDLICDIDTFTGSSDDTTFTPDLRCDLAGYGPVGRSTARRHACDAWIGAIVRDANGEILFCGRQRRTFNRAQRRAMIARDGDHCVWPGCTVPADECDAHHLDPYANGGPTDIDNGAHTCKSHHWYLHEGHWTLWRHHSTWHVTPPTRPRC
jgi:hypothetical protein